MKDEQVEVGRQEEEAKAIRNHTIRAVRVASGVVEVNILPTDDQYPLVALKEGICSLSL